MKKLYYMALLFAALLSFSHDVSAENRKSPSDMVNDLDKEFPRPGDRPEDYLDVEVRIQAFLDKKKSLLRKKQKESVLAGKQEVKRVQVTLYKGKQEDRTSSVYGDPWIIQPNGERVQYKGNSFIYEFDQYGLAAYEYIFVDERDYITSYMRREQGGQWLCADLKGTTRFVDQAQRALAPCAKEPNVANNTPMVGLIRIGGYTILAPPARQMRIFMAKILTNKKMLANELNEALQDRTNYWHLIQYSAVNLSRLWTKKQHEWLEAGEGSTSKASSEFEQLVKKLMKRCAALHLLKP